MEIIFMKTISWLTEKGNVSVKARSLVKAQVIEMLKNRLGVDVFDSPKGLAFEVAVDQAGHPIYAVIEPTLTQSLDVKEKVSKSKATVEIDIPSLFE